MGWKEADRMSLRMEFVHLARCGGVSTAELCRRFGISRTTGYKWLSRAGALEGTSWASDRSRRPHRSPSRTPPLMEEAVLAVRREHPAWGGRKIARVLENVGHRDTPSPSTITEILRRHGLLSVEEGKKRQAHVRFEREEPNLLWQMDFKGHFSLADGKRSHPLVVVDDCSRYLLALEAREHERQEDVRAVLEGALRTHGLPFEMLMDNGSVWGGPSTPTGVAIWLMRLFIRVSHGRPYHPQTQGKCERLNRSLKAEVLGEGVRFRDLAECQLHLDRFRECYNHERPHEALSLEAPAQHYRASPVAYPEHLPPIEYLDGDLVRQVVAGGGASLKSRFYHVGRGFAGEPVAFRPTIHDGVYDIFYCQTRLRRIDLRNPDFTKYERKSRETKKSATAGDENRQ